MFAIPICLMVITPTMWSPLDISCFISLMNYSYKCHKTYLLELETKLVICYIAIEAMAQSK